MKITFVNKSDTSVLFTMQGTEFTNVRIDKGEAKECELSQEAANLILIPDGISEVTYLFAKLGVISKRYFKATAEYSFSVTDNMTIDLVTNKCKGKFKDEYERILPVSAQGEFEVVKFSVSDEVRIKNILEKAISKGDSGLKIFDAFDILGNSLAGLLILVIPFILIWIFGDIQLAAKICGIAFIPIFLVILIINRLFDKLKRKAWKKLKEYMLRNQIFKDYNSYFDNKYISDVFRSKK